LNIESVWDQLESKIMDLRFLGIIIIIIIIIIVIQVIIGATGIVTRSLRKIWKLYQEYIR